MNRGRKNACADVYPLGVVPELGVVPTKMFAQVIRAERFGEPRQAFQPEVVEIPSLGPRDVLVYVMAAGVNYNNVWAALGVPLNVIDARRKERARRRDDAHDDEPAGRDFHIGGSDASGIVWRVGRDVKSVAVGDEVVIHCGMWDHDDPWVAAGLDPMFAPSQKIWGYESNWGSFAQYARVQEHQCLPKPPHLTWEQAAAYMLVAATAYRMLHGWQPHVLTDGSPVLVWGGAGGLGSMAIQIARAAGARPVAVVSHDSKEAFCKRLGAIGVIDRRKFAHWGVLPSLSADGDYARWLAGVRGFGAAFWAALGEKANPAIVLEHPGESTLPTSCFVCNRGGMVVICAGTTGYKVTLDLRYHWMHQKRLQGSHFANDEQARMANDLVAAGKVDPCLSRVFRFAETAACHQLMRDNEHPSGNMAILVNAPRPGLRTLAEVRATGSL
jgi:crotonyl-CoA carboxylase/reductase